MPVVDCSMHVYTRVGTTGTAASAPSVAATKAASNDDGFSFSDLLDVVNPLQHLPVIGTLYRKLTGDEIAAPAKIAGDTLYGGVPGLISSVADTAFEKITGKNFGGTVLSLFDGGDDQPKVAQETVQQSKFAALDMRAPDLGEEGSSPATVALAQLTAAPRAEELTAALNRAQIDRARAASAYTQAAVLAKTPDAGPRLS